MEKEKHLTKTNISTKNIFLIVNICFFVLLFSFGLHDETKDDFLMQSYFMSKDGPATPFHV